MISRELICPFLAAGVSTFFILDGSGIDAILALDGITLFPFGVCFAEPIREVILELDTL